MAALGAACRSEIPRSSVLLDGSPDLWPDDRQVADDPHSAGGDEDREAGMSAADLRVIDGDHGPGGLVGCRATRTMDNLPDDSAEYQVRALYVLPSDGIDEMLDVNGRLCDSIR